MMTYNWQKPDWPHFKYDLTKSYEILFSIAEKAGLIQGKLSHLDKTQQTDTIINLMVEEAVKTSEIEEVELQIDFILKKSAFFDVYVNELNE